MECRHPSCSCTTQRGEEYCSAACRDAGADAAEHARCDCGHDDCARSAMEAPRPGQSGRIGYLVLYLMGVPVGVLLLLWVLFGNNLIGRG